MKLESRVVFLCTDTGDSLTVTKGSGSSAILVGWNNRLLMLNTGAGLKNESVIFIVARKEQNP